MILPVPWGSAMLPQPPRANRGVLPTRGEIMDNIILIDWLSFTIIGYAWQQVAEEMGLPLDGWELSHGVRGYSDRVYMDGISYHSPSDLHPELWVEMSGQGCRRFESSGHGDWLRLLDFAKSEGHITRLDVAYDDHNNVLDIDQLYWDTFHQKYISKAKAYQLIYSNKGVTIDIGSPASDVLIRIYDKSKERQCAAGEHWIRVELQLRKDRALAFLNLPGKIGDNWAGVISNYLRYVDEDANDTNRWRWPLKDYWSALLQDAEDIQLWQNPGTEYNVLRCEKFVYLQAGNAIRTLMELYGADAFFERLDQLRTGPLPAKYRSIIESYGNDRILDSYNGAAAADE